VSGEEGFPAEWDYFVEHIDEEDPTIQRWYREDKYAVKEIMRSGWVARDSIRMSNRLEEEK